MKEKSILIVDDNADCVFTFQLALEIEGYSIIASTKPLELLKTFKSNSDEFSLILIDLRMPEMSGIEFASKIREISKEIKIWLVSSCISGIKEDPLYASANFERIIAKPVSIEKLVYMVKSTANC